MISVASTFHEGILLLEYFLFPTLSEPGSSLCWHITEPEHLHSTTFSNAILPRQQSLLAQHWAHVTYAVPTKNATPTVLLFHQPWAWSHPRSTAICDAILLFLSPASQNRQQSPLAQSWTHKTCTVTTKIAPPPHPHTHTWLLWYQPWHWVFLTFAAFRNAILLFLSPSPQKRQQSLLAQHSAHRTRAVPNQDCSPRVLSLLPARELDPLPSTIFVDAILLFLSPPSQNQE